MSNIDPVMRRMRRKLTIMRLDSKAAFANTVLHDIDELIALMDLLEKELRFENLMRKETDK
jgi:hypothetical protein